MRSLVGTRAKVLISYFRLSLRGRPFDKSLVHAVESVVVEWSHQIRDVLKKSSAQPLLEGKNPGPLLELDFWVARRADLESVLEQLCSEKVQKMSRLLEKTLSSYYPAYRAMSDTVVASLDEARDIRLVGGGHELLLFVVYMGN